MMNGGTVKVLYVLRSTGYVCEMSRTSLGGSLLSLARPKKRKIFCFVKVDANRGCRSRVYFVVPQNFVCMPLFVLRCIFVINHPASGVLIKRLFTLLQKLPKVPAPSSQTIWKGSFKQHNSRRGLGQSTSKYVVFSRLFLLDINDINILSVCSGSQNIWWDQSFMAALFIL